MQQRWNIIFEQGATYQVTITVTGVPLIETATGWRITCAMKNDDAFLVATTDNYISAGATSNQKVLTVPSTLTAAFETGNGRYDFDILWAGNIVRRYISNGYVQVNPKAG
jgi:hypothetical protein